jgi:LmbE family N-acetylglucosaminyl deacetylase
VNWVFLSPHFDDAVLSCGGLIWEKTQSGDSVQICTICAGEIPAGSLSPFAAELHQRWKTGRDAVASRRDEDIVACEKIDADWCHLPVPDCIYRRSNEDYFNSVGDSPPVQQSGGDFLYPTQWSIFGRIHPADQDLIEELGERIRRILPAGARLVCPLAIGNHVDHQITRRIAELIGNAVWYYADFPYVLEDTEINNRLKGQGWQDCRYEVSPEGLQAWYESITAYQSQISTFWPSLGALRIVLGDYLERNDGIRLWKLPG